VVVVATLFKKTANKDRTPPPKGKTRGDHLPHLLATTCYWRKRGRKGGKTSVLVVWFGGGMKVPGHG